MKDEINYSENDVTVLEMTNEVEHVVMQNRNLIDIMIEKVLLNLDLADDVELRRDWDGVSQASYMVEKMIGELLANGKPKRWVLWNILKLERD